MPRAKPFRFRVIREFNKRTSVGDDQPLINVLSLRNEPLGIELLVLHVSMTHGQIRTSELYTLLRLSGRQAAHGVKALSGRPEPEIIV